MSKGLQDTYKEICKVRVMNWVKVQSQKEKKVLKGRGRELDINIKNYFSNL